MTSLFRCKENLNPQLPDKLTENSNMKIHSFSNACFSTCIGLFAFASTSHAQINGDLFVSVNGNGGNGKGSVYRYHPDGSYTTFAPNLDRPRGVAFDNTPPPTGPNLFVATNTRNPNDPSGSLDYGTIFKFAPDGSRTPFATGFPSNFFLQSLVIDSAGYVFVVGAYNSAPNFTYPDTIYKIPPGGTQNPTPFFIDALCSCSVPGDARGIAFDNTPPPNGPILYAPDSTNTNPDGSYNVYTFKQNNDGTVSRGFFSVPGGPYIVAFDSLGNLFGSMGNPPFDYPVGMSYPNGTSLILKFTPAGAPYEPTPTGTPGVFATGIAESRGLAFDSAGNLFVADVPASTPGNIIKFTPAGAPYQPTPTGTPGVFASGIGAPAMSTCGNCGPEYLAFPPNTSASTTSETVSIGTVGSANTNISLMFPNIQTGGTTMATPIDPSTAGTLPGGFEVSGGSTPLAFDISTTATTNTSTTPIIVAFTLPAASFNPTLQVFHSECSNSPPGQCPVCNQACTGGCTLVNRTLNSSDPGYPTNPTPNTLYASVCSLSPFVIAKLRIPTDKNQCKDDGWRNFRRADGTQFKNQGACIQYVNTGK